MKSGKDRPASGGKIFPARPVDGRAYFFRVLIAVLSPFRFLLFLAQPGLTAGIIGAYLRLAVLGVGRAVHRVAARGYGLGPEGLRVEARGHLRGDDAAQILLHVHLPYRAVLSQHGDGFRGGRHPGRGRRDHRRGERRLVHRRGRRRICLPVFSGRALRAPVCQKGQSHRDQERDIGVKDRSFHGRLLLVPATPKGVRLDGMGKRG